MSVETSCHELTLAARDGTHEGECVSRRGLYWIVASVVVIDGNKALDRTSGPDSTLVGIFSVFRGIRPRPAYNIPRGPGLEEFRHARNLLVFFVAGKTCLGLVDQDLSPSAENDGVVWGR
jgi:hypothetical protein